MTYKLITDPILKRQQYSELYFYLTRSRQILGRKKNKERNPYFEDHHIIPKCFQGSNKKENKVLLLAREHFIAHKLLVEMYEDGWKKDKMIQALWNMCRKGKNQKRIYTAKEYEEVRILFAQFQSKFMKNFKPTEETKKKQSKSLTGKKRAPFTIEHKNNLSKSMMGEKNPNFGKEKSPSTKKKMSIAQKGKKLGKIPWNKGKVSPLLRGRKMSVASKEKIRLKAL